MSISAEELELVGALLGDGNIYTNHGKYLIAFTGDPKKELGYFNHLSKLIEIAWGKHATPRVRSNGVRIAVYSKELVSRLTTIFCVPTGNGKCEKIYIPYFVLSDWNLCKHFIRGLFDTDGTVFTSDKRGCLCYPSIEFTTTSNTLIEQLLLVLREHGFRTTNVWQYCSKNSKKTTFKIALNGNANLRKWLAEIGFSNNRKLCRAQDALITPMQRLQPPQTFITPFNKQIR